MKHRVDIGELCRLYRDGLTSRQIGEVVGVPFRTVLRYLKAAGTVLRNPGDPVVKALSDREWLQMRYLSDGRSTPQIAAEIGCTARTVSLWLRRHGLPARAIGSEKGHKRTTEEARRKMSIAGKGKRLGPANPNWKGGLSPHIDPVRRDSRVRIWVKAVKARDNWQCVECGSTDGELHAHHIKPWRSYPEFRFDIQNGQTLCYDCHQTKHKFRFKHAKRPTSAPHPDGVMI